MFYHFHHHNFHQNLSSMIDKVSCNRSLMGVYPENFVTRDPSDWLISDLIPKVFPKLSDFLGIKSEISHCSNVHKIKTRSLFLIESLPYNIQFVLVFWAFDYSSFRLQNLFRKIFDASLQF